MRKNINLVDELGDDLVWAFLVEKKFDGKFSPENAVALIGQVKGILGGTSEDISILPAKPKSENHEAAFSV